MNCFLNDCLIFLLIKQWWSPNSYPIRWMRMIFEKSFYGKPKNLVQWMNECCAVLYFTLLYFTSYNIIIYVQYKHSFDHSLIRLLWSTSNILNVLCPFNSNIDLIWCLRLFSYPGGEKNIQLNYIENLMSWKTWSVFRPTTTNTNKTVVSL